MELPRLIKRSMLEEGVETVAQLSTLSGVSRFKISALLRGEDTIKLCDLKLVADALNINICYKVEWK